MSDEKTYTEREVVLRERRAFVQALVAETPKTYASAAALAARAFPLPKVTRQRTVSDPHESFEWRVIDGKLKARHSERLGDWFIPADCGQEGGGGFVPTAARVELWADLLANPTETVEDES